MLELFLIIPLIVALLSILPNSRHSLNILSLLGSSAILVNSLVCGYKVLNLHLLSGLNGNLVLDQLSFLIAFIIALITFLSSIYSVGYLGNELEKGHFSLLELRRYHALLYLFVSTMFLVVTTVSLGLLWVGMEATTLSSALLVIFYKKDSATEAGWKYLVLCTVGIAFALFGTVFMYLAAFKSFGEASYVLNWDFLAKNAASLNPKLVKIAFIFVLVGYGTKAGFVPMHTWLPDAHSQAPTPVSAMLSGVMLNCAMYAILRYFIITQNAIGNGYASKLMLIFGLLSVLVSTPFILLQTNFKRLLAYSSIENIGVIAIGIGFGGKLGLYGALLHLLNHSLTKCLMFFSVGNIRLKYNTTISQRIQGGLIYTMPVTATLLALGTMAIIGLPPFGLFLSKFFILLAGITQGNYLAVSAYLIALIIVAAGFISHIFPMILGRNPEKVDSGEISFWNITAMFLLVCSIITLGLYLPSSLNTLLNEAVQVISSKDK